jgi:hypothetical protein
MMRDEVVDEVRAAREAYAARFGFDLTVIGRDLQARERASGRVVLAPPVTARLHNPAPSPNGSSYQDSADV